MNPFQLTFFALGLTLLAACSTAPRGIPLPNEEFQAIKERPPTLYAYTRYVGVINGYETLEYYESPSNSDLTPIKTQEYHRDPDFYLKETITLRYSQLRSPLMIADPATAPTPFSLNPVPLADATTRVHVTVSQLREKAPHPSIVGDIDQVTFKLKADQAIPRYPNCRTIILLYDQHNQKSHTGKKFAVGDAWSIHFSYTGQFRDLTPD